ncbi:MAG: zinc ABC transporter substrate-binding protein [Clostridium sp.]|nr:zinc ABC transporter substrate-binding protein [Clostridium sp.]
MKKLTYILVIFTAILFFILALFNSTLMASAEEEANNKEEVKINILTVNKELYTMTCDLVGDRHNVEYIFSEDDKIDEINKDDKFINNILQKDLFIYNGFYDEEFVNEIINSSVDSDLRIINASRGIRPINTVLTKGEKENPYYLLGFSEYKVALYNIKIALQERDVENRNYYEENYNRIIEKLDKALQLIKKEIQEYDNFEIYTNTDRFDYIFRDLDLEVNKIDSSNKEVKEGEGLKEEEIQEEKDFEEVESYQELKIDEEKTKIFIYDTNSQSKENIIEETNSKFIYLGLSSVEDDNVIISNGNKIIEKIKNNNKG